MPVSLDLSTFRRGSDLLKRGFASMQKGGVIMDVTTPEQAGIAEDAGAVAVMALERVPADIRAQGGVARMADTRVVAEIVDAVTIPVMAKCRIGHFAEARVLQELGVDMIDESEVLTPADPYYHVDKRAFTVPFVCGARELGEASRRMFEGAAMIRTKGEAGTGNVVEAVRHRRLIVQAIAQATAASDAQLRALAETFADRYAVLAREANPGAKVTASTIVFGGSTLAEVRKGLHGILKDVKRLRRLPVVDFAAGGIATPADAALMMQLGNDGVFVGSGIFKSSDPATRARAIVEAVTHFDEPRVIAEVSRGLGEPMRGLEVDRIPVEQRLAGRGA
ncbi:MAG TPA: pyridoxal 5'-phosphate synthase lyase subunit PdxS [Candidatus Thermoplasmatota archaeon]|nr:pyridoxal 5'-phosphate synthase lyase subunit PdxS [Candidatus Thermoplasmatota archaeon]